MKKLSDKQRYINLMQKVNKVTINESVFDKNTGESVLYSSFEKLLSNNLKVLNKNTTLSDNETFIELKCVDDKGNEIVFSFKAITNELEHDGVFNVNEAEMKAFTFKTPNSTNNIEIDETGLKSFNEKFSSKLVDIVSDYIDIEEEPIDDEIEDNSLYELAIKKIDNLINENTNQYSKKFDVDNVAKHSFNSMNPSDRYVYVDLARNVIDDMVELTGKELNDEMFDYALKELSKNIYTLFAQKLNEEDNEYPEPIGSEFSTNSKYPKKRRKYKTKKIKIKENFGVPGYSQIRIPQDNIQEFDDDTADSLLGYEPKNVGDNYDDLDIDSIISQKEETSDVIDGGLADDKSPAEFEKEQLARGIKVEMEHTNDPLVAIEIAMDHLMEDPEYYGTDDDDPEDMAQQHASIEASEFDDYKPINVGESIDEKFTVVFDGTSTYVLEPHEEIDSDCDVIGTYDDIDAAQRAADKYNDKAQGTQMTEEEEFEVNSGDRFEDANGKQYTVNNMTNDKINIRSNDGKQQETTPDALRFTKKM